MKVSFEVELQEYEVIDFFIECFSSAPTTSDTKDLERKIADKIINLPWSIVTQSKNRIVEYLGYEGEMEGRDDILKICLKEIENNDDAGLLYSLFLSGEVSVNKDVISESEIYEIRKKLGLIIPDESEITKGHLRMYLSTLCGISDDGVQLFYHSQFLEDGMGLNRSLTDDGEKFIIENLFTDILQLHDWRSGSLYHKLKPNNGGNMKRACKRLRNKIINDLLDVDDALKKIDRILPAESGMFTATDEVYKEIFNDEFFDHPKIKVLKMEQKLKR